MITYSRPFTVSTSHFACGRWNFAITKSHLRPGCYGSTAERTSLADITRQTHGLSTPPGSEAITLSRLPTASFRKSAIEKCWKTVQMPFGGVSTIYRHCLGDRAINTSAYVLAGDSSGAGLAFMCGLYLEPRPSCVINLYGAFDMTDDFFYTVDPAYPVEAPSGDFDEATLVAASQDYDPCHAEVTCPWSHEIEPFFRIEQTRLAWGDPDFVVTRQHRLRDEMRKRLLGQRNLFRALFRREDFEDDDTFLANVRQQSPLHILDGRSDYPPTFHFHGIKDTIVPVGHTQRLVAKLEQMGMPLEAILPADADHCFDCSVMVCILLPISAR